MLIKLDILERDRVWTENGNSFYTILNKLYFIFYLNVLFVRNKNL